MNREEWTLKNGKVAWIKPLPPDLWKYSTTNMRKLLYRLEEVRRRETQSG